MARFKPDNCKDAQRLRHLLDFRAYKLMPFFPFCFPGVYFGLLRTAFGERFLRGKQSEESNQTHTPILCVDKVNR
jgi:hypothetical protein